MLALAVAARIAAGMLASAAGGWDYSTLLHGPQCRPHHHDSAAAPAWARPRRMTVLVDSVLLAGAPSLRASRPCWRVATRGGPALLLKSAAHDVSTGPRVAPLVVIGLGYNPRWDRARRGYWAARFDTDAARLLRVLRRRGARQFVWVTLREPTTRTVPVAARPQLKYTWYLHVVDRHLHKLDRRRGDLVLADWARASDRPGLTYDSIHLNPRGARLMARTVRLAIARERARQLAARRP